MSTFSVDEEWSPYKMHEMSPAQQAWHDTYMRDLARRRSIVIEEEP